MISLRGRGDGCPVKSWHTKRVLCSCLLPTLGPPAIFSAAAWGTKKPPAVWPGPYLSPQETGFVSETCLSHPFHQNVCERQSLRTMLFIDTSISSMYQWFIVRNQHSNRGLWKHLYPQKNCIATRFQVIELFRVTPSPGVLQLTPRKLLPTSHSLFTDSLYTDSLKESCHFRLHKPKLSQNQVLGGRGVNEVLLII